MLLLARFYESVFYALFYSMPSGTDSLNELGVAPVSESRQILVYVYEYLQLANSKAFYSRCLGWKRPMREAWKLLLDPIGRISRAGQMNVLPSRKPLNTSAWFRCAGAMKVGVCGRLSS